MSEVNPIAPSVDELKALIAQDVIYRHCIAKGDVPHDCVPFSGHYSEVFERHGIDHVRLFDLPHTFLAVRTRDAGLLVFDPTFNQFYPDYPEKYFLGSAQQLVDYARTRGGELGLNAIIEPPAGKIPAVTAHSAFMNHRINRSPFAPRDQGREAVNRYFKEWTDALDPIRATTQVRALETTTHPQVGASR